MTALEARKLAEDEMKAGKTPKYTDLRDWLEIVDSVGELKKIDGADWNLEMGTLAELLSRETKNGSKTRNGAHREPQQEPHREQELHRESGTPIPDSTVELPPLIGRQEVVAIVLVVLLLIAVTTVLYFAKAFFPADEASFPQPDPKRPRIPGPIHSAGFRIFSIFWDRPSV